jgi:hypothetical protein
MITCLSTNLGLPGGAGRCRQLPGYHAATPDTLQRRFLNTGGIIENDRKQTAIRLNRRTYSPILRQASLPDTITVPWREGRTLRYQYD